MRDKLKLLHIVGNRPQFIKLAAVLRALPEEDFTNVVVHSGQHYDYNMSKVFFEELGLPEPNHFLNAGSGTHDFQTARILEGLTPLWGTEKPEIALVYGDTNTTLAGALSGYKSHIPIAHVEAGMREFTWRPEEINKVVADHCSDLCFCPTELATRNLRREGVPHLRIHLTGDVTYDSFLWAVDKLRAENRTVSTDDDAVLVTMHRAETVDSDEFLINAMECLLELGLPLYFPVHPRTQNRLRTLPIWGRLRGTDRVHLLPPLGYFEFLSYLIACAYVVTDSGGVTREAYYAKKPTVVLDESTEYTELIDEGGTVLSGRKPSEIGSAMEQAIAGLQSGNRLAFGDGRGASKIGGILKCFPASHECSFLPHTPMMASSDAAEPSESLSKLGTR